MTELLSDGNYTTQTYKMTLTSIENIENLRISDNKTQKTIKQVENHEEKKDEAVEPLLKVYLSHYHRPYQKVFMFLFFDGVIPMTSI